MKSVETAIREIVQATEGRLRDLIVEAAKTGDYEGIDLLSAVAAKIHDIAEEHASQLRENGAPGIARIAELSVPRPAPVRQRPRGKWSEYPRFFVASGLLHKVGWSKKDREEYVHKLPREAYELIVQAIGETSQSGRKLVTSDQLVARLQSHDPPVPAYQVYVAMALLRSNDVVKKKGREGYAVASDVVLRAQAIWSDMESKKRKGTV